MSILVKEGVGIYLCGMGFLVFPCSSRLPPLAHTAEFQTQQGSCTYELTVVATIRVRPMQAQARQNPRYGGEVSLSPTCTEFLLSGEGELAFYKDMVLVGLKAFQSDDHILKRILPALIGLSGFKKNEEVGWIQNGVWILKELGEMVNLVKIQCIKFSEN